MEIANFGECKRVFKNPNKENGFVATLDYEDKTHLGAFVNFSEVNGKIVLEELMLVGKRYSADDKYVRKFRKNEKERILELIAGKM